MTKLAAIIDQLAGLEPLEIKHRDHALSGTWEGFRDCHVEPDWILIYRIKDEILYLERTGTHSDLF